MGNRGQDRIVRKNKSGFRVGPLVNLLFCWGAPARVLGRDARAHLDVQVELGARHARRRGIAGVKQRLGGVCGARGRTGRGVR